MAENLSLIENPLPFNAEDLRAMSPERRAEALSRLTKEEMDYLQYCWPFWARRNFRRFDAEGEFTGKWGGQLPPPGDWFVWVFQAGRASGKTRSGAEFIKHQIVNRKADRVALVGPTADDVRAVMVEGNSGLLSIFPPSIPAEYEPSKRRVVFPTLNAQAIMYSAEEAKRLNGPQHQFAWCDEIAIWQQPATWDMLILGLRLPVPGDQPRCVVTSTPKTEGPSSGLLKAIKKSPGTVVTIGSTFDNKANLAPSYFNKVVSKYQGTRLGRGEIEGEDLDDNPLALWKLEDIERARFRNGVAPCQMLRVVVAVDPAGSIADMARFAAGIALEDKNDGDDAGIVAAGLGEDERFYVLGDYTTGGSPNLWGKKAVEVYERWRADRILGEINHGGKNVEKVVRTVSRDVSYREVHASRGKTPRAEPISALYEQGRVSHVGHFPKLEDEMLNWVPGAPSPNRMDALVFAITELMEGSGTIEEEYPEERRY